MIVLVLRSANEEANHALARLVELSIDVVGLDFMICCPNLLGCRI
jgi:hypothetical protein